MARASSLQSILSSIFETGRIFSSASDTRSIEELCEAILSEQGEVSGTKLAAAILVKFEALDEEGKHDFFKYLAGQHDVDPDAIQKAIDAYREDPSPGNLAELTASAEPARRELFRRINQTTGATEKLVRMREDLLAMMGDDSGLQSLDMDLERLLATWFNRGFLVLQPIDWKTSANILEKIIQYEAVHAINDWDDLRRRIEPSDRRCFAFFHPVMPEEPLIFVEVALTVGTPGSVDELLAETRETLPDQKFDTAVFYSISNCQTGLKGVSFGNFLIKQVVSDLMQEFPRLKNFVTLSPVPRFRHWLRSGFEETPSKTVETILEALEKVDEGAARTTLNDLEGSLRTLLARYFLEAKGRGDMPYDPVARFHLGNGASLAQFNWMADLSDKGLKQSACMMVNYRYDLNSVEDNHETYVRDKVIHTTREIRSLAKESLK